MLQQTRAESVKAYFTRFITLFPTLAALASASQEVVLKAWEGLGYYSRARNIHQSAQTIVQELDGQFPRTYPQLLRLPGIGAYTAGAIASIAFGERVPAIDGNVYRVATRYFGIRENIHRPQTRQLLRNFIIESLPHEQVGIYNQALMELGATVCIPRIPKCEQCPLRTSCDAFAEQDAEHLPVREKKRPPKLIELAVCLLTYENQVLVVRRSQKMLHGLYVFMLIEQETDSVYVQDILVKTGLNCVFLSHLGVARHVFTHRIWNMSILHFRLTQKPNAMALEAIGAKLVFIQQELLALPMPTAMKIARDKAMALSERETAG